MRSTLPGSVDGTEEHPGVGHPDEHLPLRPPTGGVGVGASPIGIHAASVVTRTSMVSNIDGDGPAQALLSDAALIRAGFASGALSPRRAQRSPCGAVLVMAVYAGWATVHDATRFASIPYGHTQTVSLNHTFHATVDLLNRLQARHADDAAAAQPLREGVTSVTLSEGDTDVVQATLSVHSLEPLPAGSITNSDQLRAHQRRLVGG